MQNPEAGREGVLMITRTAKVKKVMVVGGGCAGMEAAIVAKQRGHDVTLFEKSDRIGGQLHTASRMAIKHDIKRYLENLEYQMSLLQKEGLKVVFNTYVRPKNIGSRFDVIICCNGLSTVIPSIEGLDMVRHLEAREFLDNGMELPSDVKNVLIVGGGIIGCEVAYSLAYEKDVSVTIVGKNDVLMPDTVMANRGQMLWMMFGGGSPSGKKEDALKEQITVYNASNVTRFTGRRVHILANRGRSDPYTPWKALIPQNVKNPFNRRLDPDNVEKLTLDTDMVIIATGAQADDSLYFELLKERAADEIYSAGDAKEPGRVWEAITGANEISRNI
jgi:2-enoate reductase